MNSKVKIINTNEVSTENKEIVTDNQPALTNKERTIVTGETPNLIIVRSFIRQKI